MSEVNAPKLRYSAGGLFFPASNSKELTLVLILFSQSQGRFVLIPAQSHQVQPHR